MSDHQFRKFPRTHHLMDLGATTRDDLVCSPSEVNIFLNNPTLTIEEKVDGANLGISLDDNGEIRCQKRGHFVAANSESQFHKLDAWIIEHKTSLLKILANGNILFGEWMVAQHSVAYDCLPDWFLAFDVFEVSSSSFLSVSKRDELLRGSGIHTVRKVLQGSIASLDQLVGLVNNLEAAFSQKVTRAEGVYLRIDCEGKLKARAKIVHPSFRQAIADDGHWASRKMVCNVIRPDIWEVEEEEVFYVSIPGKSATRILFRNGVICAVGPTIEEIAQSVSEDVPEKARNSREAKSGAGHHLTLLKPQELQALTQPEGQFASGRDLADYIESQVDLNGWISLGLGICSLEGSTSFFAVIAWPSAEAIRVKLGLKPCSHDFHVTIGFFHSDVHGVKSVASLMHPPGPLSTNEAAILALTDLCGISNQNEAHLIRSLVDQSIDRMSKGEDRDGEMARFQLCWLLIKAKRAGKDGNYEECLSLLDQKELDKAIPSTLCSYVHLICGKAYWGLDRFEEARKAFEAALASRSSRDDERKSPAAVGKLLTELSKMWSRDAALQGLSACSKRIQTTIPDCSVNTRDRFSVEIRGADGSSETVTLPRNTSWLIKDRVLGSSIPTSREQILAFRQKLNVGLVVTLMEEGPLPTAWFDNSGVCNLFVPVVNYHPPSQDQMLYILREMESCIKEMRSVLVHCGGGKGRAGTVLACYLLKHGLSDHAGEESFLAIGELRPPQMTSDEAIRAIRGLRPGSIETERQEQFVSSFSAILWKQQEADFNKTTSGGVLRSPDEDPATDPDQAATAGSSDPKKVTDGAASGSSTKEMKEKASRPRIIPRLIMLVGLPGSGKSTFANALVESSKDSFTRISQDECGGSRRDCEAEFGLAFQKRRGGAPSCVILDRCNATIEDRKQWLSAADQHLLLKRGEGRGSRGALAVFFDLDPRACIERIAKREGHPTLPPERGEKAVASFAKTLEPPSPSEGFLLVIHVKSQQDADHLLETLGCRL